MEKIGQWRLLNDKECENPHWAMAVEEAILRTLDQGLTPNTLRLWRNRNAVIIGRFQCPKLETVLDSCLINRTVIVRRFTGGGAVYQDSGNLNFAIFVRTDLGIGAASNIFEKVGLAITMSLENLGIPSELDKMSVHVKGRKLSGMAGMIMKRAVLAHGCLLVDSDLEVLYRVLNFDRENAISRFSSSRLDMVSTIRNELGERIALSEVEQTLTKSFEEVFKSFLTPGKLTIEEIDVAKKLYEERYSKLQWTLATCEECPQRERCTYFALSHIHRTPQVQMLDLCSSCGTMR